jgi:hypothetical protein
MIMWHHTRSNFANNDIDFDREVFVDTGETILINLESLLFPFKNKKGQVKLWANYTVRLVCRVIFEKRGEGEGCL